MHHKPRRATIHNMWTSLYSSMPHKSTIFQLQKPPLHCSHSNSNLLKVWATTAVPLTQAINFTYLTTRFNKLNKLTLTLVLARQSAQQLQPMRVTEINPSVPHFQTRAEVLDGINNSDLHSHLRKKYKQLQKPQAQLAKPSGSTRNFLKKLATSLALAWMHHRRTSATMHDMWTSLHTKNKNIQKIKHVNPIPKMATTAEVSITHPSNRVHKPQNSFKKLKKLTKTPPSLVLAQEKAQHY